MSEQAPVRYEENEGIARIIFNRPETLNALNKEVLQQLASLLDKVRAEDAVKAVIVTGAGDESFSAGAETLGKVVAAAINGYALGGGLELAEACMFRVAVRHARLGHPEVRIGAIAGFGGTTPLPRLIGKGRATELLLTGRLTTAEEAHQIGLVHRVVEPENLLSETEELLREVLAQSPGAVRLTWEAIHRGLNLTLEESTLLGADYFGLVAATDEFRQRTKSFLEEKRASRSPAPASSSLLP